MKHVVITGVSSGIGRAAAEELGAHGYHVFGSVRKEADADSLQARLGELFTPLFFDVTDEKGVKAGCEKVAKVLGGDKLDGLVNNAGIGTGGPIMFQPMNEIRQVFEVNVFGMLRVTQTFLPFLRARNPQSEHAGRIVNISSVGGKLSLPFLGAYAGSKHAVEGLSDSLRRELAIYGIDVIVIEPGAVITPIWDKAESEGFADKYKDTIYGPIASKFEQGFIAQGRRGIPVEVVAKTIRQALESEYPKTRYVLTNNPVFGWLIPRLLPDRWLDRIITSQIGLSREKQNG
jgi:NAD(P)-dependent dehydrogenase (short-subunit alcohol dehydrogenase family)